MSNPLRRVCWRECSAAALATETEPVPPPRATAFGALMNYICHADAKHFQPANITFDLLLPLDEATAAAFATRSSVMPWCAKERWGNCRNGSGGKSNRSAHGAVAQLKLAFAKIRARARPWSCRQI